MTEDQIQWLKDNLKLDIVETQVQDSYGGSYGGEFKTRKTVQLLAGTYVIDYVEFIS